MNQDVTRLSLVGAWGLGTRLVENGLDKATTYPNMLDHDNYYRQVYQVPLQVWRSHCQEVSSPLSAPEMINTLVREHKIFYLVYM